MLKSLLAAGAILVASISTASAVTVTQAATPGVAFASLVATSSTGTYDPNVTDPGLVPGRRSIWEGTTLDGSVYSSITGTATYEFAAFQKSVSFVWGSPDDYNDIDFYKGATLVFTINGTAIIPCCGLNVASSLVTIDDLGGFNKIVLRSTQAALEYGNFTVAAVPLPAGGLLLIGAIGGLAALRRRKIAA